MRILFLTTVVACGGTVRPTCDRMPFEPIDADEATPIGSIEEVVAEFDDAFVLDDGRVGSLTVELDGQGSYADHVPGTKVTGLPPYDHLLNYVDCTDQLAAPVAWTVTIDGVTTTGLGELFSFGGFQSYVTGDGLDASTFEGSLQSVSLTTP